MNQPITAVSEVDRLYQETVDLVGRLNEDANYWHFTNPQMVEGHPTVLFSFVGFDQRYHFALSYTEGAVTYADELGMLIDGDEFLNKMKAFPTHQHDAISEAVAYTHRRAALAPTVAHLCNALPDSLENLQGTLPKPGVQLVGRPSGQIQ